MNLDALQKKLLRSAKRHAPSDRIPYAFEQRIMAHIRCHQILMDPVQAWAQGLMRAMVPCFGLFLLVAAWNWNQSNGSQEAAEMSGSAEALEVAIVHAIDTNEGVEDSW